MTEIVFDFADIRSRMLGDDKPKPKPKNPEPVPTLFGADPARPGSDQTIIHTRIPRAAWRKLTEENVRALNLGFDK